MSVTLAVGTAVSIASAYSAALPFTGGTNAAETVLAMASTTGLSAGDFAEITSGWGLLSGRVVRIKTVVAGVSITLEGIDTSDVVKFPGAPTGAAGSVRKIATWTGLSQLTKDINISGGDQQYADITSLDDRTQRQIPTVRSPLQVSLGSFFDASLAWVASVRAASDSATPTAVRMVYPNGSRTLGNAYWTLADVPTITDNTLRAAISLAFSSLPVNYAT